jgi:type VII secretion protein EccE
VKARTVAINPALGAVVGAEVVAIAAFAALPPYRFSWWPFAAITTIAVILLLVTVHRRNAARWLLDRARWRRQRRYTTLVGAAVDISHNGQIYGVRTAGNEAVTMIQVDGLPYEPTFLRGSNVSLTRNVLPLQTLIEVLRQPGDLYVEIDIASVGYRVRTSSGYPQLYSTLLADRGAAGHRTTHLIVRLDIQESIRGLGYRHSIGSAAAAATERIITRLQQQGIRSAPLNREEQDAVLEQLSLGLAQAPTLPDPPQDRDDDIGADVEDQDVLGEQFDEQPVRALATAGAKHRAPAPAATKDEPRAPRRARLRAEVGWNTINAKPGFVTSYYFSPEDITSERFNQMWALRSDDIVHVMMLRRQRGAPAMVSALLRTNDPRRPEQPPTLFLNPLPGNQYTAALRAAPTSQPRLKLPAAVLHEPDKLDTPIGPTGILVGSALHDDETGWPQIQRDDLVMLPLTDPLQPTRITMDTSEFYVRQQLIRAAATGERIAIYSRNPRRWFSVSQPNIAVVEPRRPAEFVPTIIVNDRPHVAPSVGVSSTVITLGGNHSDASTPDIRFEQTSDTTVRITRRTRREPLDVAMVIFRQEQAFTG